jgi:hypothetical protein
MPAKSELNPEFKVLIERVDATLDLKVLIERVDTVLREASGLLADLQLSRTHRMRMVEIGQGMAAIGPATAGVKAPEGTATRL